MSIGVNNMRGSFDLKVGYACNNRCVHCVVETNRLDALNNNCEKMDLTYGDIINIMNEPEFINASSVTITGGEPTLRKDIVRIIRYISNNYPDKRIILQTNGRLLGKYIDEFLKASNNIYYVVAIHSMECNLHNKIVGLNNKSNPYKETINSLLKLKQVYGTFENTARIEIVLSKLNYQNVPQTIKELYDMGFKSIGISYPHLDGFYQNMGIEKVKEIGLSYQQLKSIIPEVYKLAIKNKDLYMAFEAVPRCMWRDENDMLLDLPSNITSMSEKPLEASIRYPDGETSNFTDMWDDMHEKSSQCTKCCNKNCLGVWFESIRTYGDCGFVPISELEYKQKGEYSCS